MNKKDKGLEYLKVYPQLKKWINTCIICGSIGYNPELPEVLSRSSRMGEHWTAAAQNIRKYFQPLQVNELSICDVCQKICCTDIKNAGQNNR